MSDQPSRREDARWLASVLPTRIETRRLYLRSYQASDGAWYYAMSVRNRTHLARYEAGNAIFSIHSESDAWRVMEDFAQSWSARKAFFIGTFELKTDVFVAQIYIGVVSWDLPELVMGYFADVDHQGQGYVSEAVRGALGFCFEHLGAHRVRLETDDTNRRSQRVVERCGFVREGHTREDKRNPDGTITGTLHYGLLRDEY